MWKPVLVLARPWEPGRAVQPLQPHSTETWGDFHGILGFFIESCYIMVYSYEKLRLSFLM